MEKFRDIVHHHLKINHEIISGDITLKELIEHRWKFMVQEGFKDYYKILVDIRDANFIDFMDEFPVFINYAKRASACFNLRRKCAFLTSKPEHVAYTEIMKSGLVDIENSYIIEVFSTETAAINWLLK